MLMSAHLALAAAAALALVGAHHKRRRGGGQGRRFDAEADYVLSGVGDKAGRSITIPADAGGLGGTPNNAEVDHLGFVAWMTPSDFLKLNPDRPVAPAAASKAAWLHRGIGAPMLYVDLIDLNGGPIIDLLYDADDGDPQAKVALDHARPALVVKSHEGRGRSMFIREHLGEVEVPVTVIFRGEIRSYLFGNAPDLLGRAAFLSNDRRQSVPNRAFQLRTGRGHASAQGSLSLRHGKRRLWAGTQRKNLGSIFERGLVPQGGPKIHNTKTKGLVFLAGSREGAWRYADYGDDAEPAIVEVDVEGLELYPDEDDAGQTIRNFIKEIKDISGVTVRDDDTVDEDDVEAVQEAISEIVDSQDHPITASVEVDESGEHYFKIDPKVSIPIDHRFVLLDPEDRESLEGGVDGLYYDPDGIPHQRVEQYQHYGLIPPERILGAYVRAHDEEPNLSILNFGRLVDVDGSSAHWRREPLVFIQPPPRQQVTGSLSRPQSSRKALERLRRAALRVAAQDTAYDAGAYRAARAQGRSPLVGHCNAMAYVVQSRLGGEIVEGRVGKERHMWNRLPGGVEVDLTSDQYGGDGFTPVASPRRDVPARAAANKRFVVFRDRVAKQLGDA